MLTYQIIRNRHSKFICYYRHGSGHRKDGPSGIWEYGDRYWFQYGGGHRTDGPAIITKHRNEYWLRDIKQC